MTAKPKPAWDRNAGETPEQTRAKHTRARQLARLTYARRRLDILITSEPLFTADQLEKLAWILWDAADARRGKDE